MILLINHYFRTSPQFLNPFQKKSACRHFRHLCHNIKDCFEYHAGNEGVVMDDHETRQRGCSTVYYFPNQPSKEYNSAVVLANSPMRKFCYQSDYNLRSPAPDYLMDQKLDPVDGQEFHFTTRETKPIKLPKPNPSVALKSREKL